MTAFENAYEQVQVLVNTFQQNFNHYMSPGYSEAEARQDFIDNFFTALGWDVRHTTQTNPYEQEVKIEKSQKQQNESARKRADYAFFIGPNYKDEVFFAEAKKPSVLIQNNPQHYFQTIKYGWNSGCPICVLTDFEELVIIDCRNKPDLKYALNGKHKTYRYTDYSNKELFAEIYWLFSREAVGNNSLTNYAEQLPKAKGKAVQKALFKGSYKPVDEDFLEELDAIRENIAKAFKKANEELDSEQLTEATQRTVDRLVFIRFLEDKFIEAAEHVSEWTSWKDFITDCRRLDAKYNGVVFKKHFIDEPHFIGADENLFLNICSDISNLNSPYDFNYIPIHILGSIYERFLGKVVRATDKRVFIEEKPEVRKAGGVYYTPKYIVDYIVKNTIGKIIEGLTPKQIAEKRFADIACGSGSFLIGVYDYLLDYHKKYYTEKLSGKTEIDKRSEDFANTEFKEGQWLLTLKLKQDILLNNIYGVDIDAQAVEVTQLSLFLKMLEEENVSSTQLKQGALFSKVLPDLSKNIVCGNSLIGFDIMNGQLFEDTELKKLNPMDYETVFPAIMKNGGFDAVVGNPPYVRVDTLDINSKKYISNNYNSAKGKYDLYYLFLESAVKKINQVGILGYIIPNRFTTSDSGFNLRSVLLKNTRSIFINSVSKIKVFKNASTYPCIIFASKSEKLNRELIICETIHPDSISFFDKMYGFSNDEIIKLPNLIFPLNSKKELIDIFFRLKNTCKLSKDYLIIQEGLRLAKEFEYENGDIHIIKQYQFSRYSTVKEGSYIKTKDLTNCVSTSSSRYINCLKEKLIIAEDALRVEAILDDSKSLCQGGVYFATCLNDINCDLKYLLGIYNSSIFNTLYNSLFSGMHMGGGYLRYRTSFLNELPIANSQKQQRDKLVDLVTQMLESKKQLAAAVTDSDKNFLQNKCASIDRQIDKLVYELYELTEEEIKIVEGNN